MNCFTSESKPTCLSLSLRQWSVLTATIHAIQALMVFGITIHKDTRVQLRENFAMYKDVNGTKSIVYGYHETTNINLKYLPLCFFLLSAIFQSAPALKDEWWEWLREKRDVHGVNIWRWIEYSISASCLLLVNAVSSGIVDRSVLVLIFFANATIMLLGLVQENHASLFSNRMRSRNTVIRFIDFTLPHLIGWLLYAPLWGLMFRSLHLSINHSDKTPPSWVFAIIILNFLLFTSFGVVQLYEMILTFRNILDDNYKRILRRRCEFYYMLLSLLAKSICAWIFVQGIMATTQN